MLIRAVFILTLFSSAFLSFSIQPILGKMMLPLVGGAASAWIVTMAFFQLALLGGYTLSHILRHVSPIYHGLALCVIYAAGLTVLPVQFPAHMALSENPILIARDVFSLLLQTIALPFIALTATTSALLRMFSRTHDSTAQDPYYLFIASNAGSLIGLFIFPLWLERIFELRQLSQFWFIGYSVVIGGLIVALLLTWKNRATTTDNTTPRTQTPVSYKQMISWFCLAFVPCSLSMGVTALITTDMGSFPLFWTLPLGLYLLSFIFAFQQKPIFKLDDLYFWHVCAAGILFILVIQGGLTRGQGMIDMTVSFIILLGLFFVICLSVHQTLATQRPDPDRLTLYYLIIALGGAVAGLCNAFLVPLIFNDASEFILSLGASLLLPMIWRKTFIPPHVSHASWIFPVAFILSVAILILHHFAEDWQVGNYILIASLFIFMLCMFVILFKPRYLALFTVAVMLHYMHSAYMGDYLIKYRNFFGSSVVQQYNKNGQTIRALRHGNTQHGMALIDKDGHPIIDMSIGYYSNKGPVQDIYNLVKPRNVAILGLGTGQLACYDRKASVTFYEIDPDMVGLAENYFPYLKACPVKDIVIGDGRLTFMKSNDTYDMLIMDAFSSDGIPVHLLTREAMQIYRQRLNDNGVILFHISNRYFALASQIAATAHSLGYASYHKGYNPNSKTSPFAMISEWVAVITHDRFGEALVSQSWTALDPTRAVPWTDQKSSLMSALYSFKNKNPPRHNTDSLSAPLDNTDSKH